MLSTEEKYDGLVTMEQGQEGRSVAPYGALFQWKEKTIKREDWEASFWKACGWQRLLISHDH